MMLIQMLADRFGAGGVLYARGTQQNVPDDLALRWIGDGVAKDIDAGRSAVQGTQAALTGPWNPGAPGAPRSVRALARNGAAMVYWESAASGVPDSYIVTASNGAQRQVQATARSQSVEFTGLSNGTPVSFTVQSSTLGGGVSVSSAASNVVTPTALPSATLPVTDGLMAWYDTILQPGLPANGAELATWTDLSGNGFNATRPGGAGTGGTVVASWSNSKPAIQLNGTTQYLTASGLIVGAYGPLQTIYLVADVQSNASAGRMVSNETTSTLNANSGTYLGFSGTGPSTPSARSGIPSAINAPTVALNTAFDAVMVTPGQLFMSGVAVATPLDAVTLTSDATLCIGAQNGGTSPLACRIATVIVFAALHTAAQQAAMRSFLATRF